MVEMAILGAVVSMQKELNSTVQWLSFLKNVQGGKLFIYLEGCFALDPSISSCYVVLGFPSVLF